MQSKKGFTLVELVIVIVIMVTLSTIGFVQYSTSLIDSRNAARISDMGNLKISLKNYKLKSGTYPSPGNYFSVLNTAGSGIIKQGKFDENVYITDLTTTPKDPQLKIPYFYSTTYNGLYMQIALSIEDTDETNQNGYKSMVDGDYQQVNSDVPSIVFAQSTGSTLNNLNCIVNNSTINIPYGEDGNFIQSATTISDVITQSGVTIPKFFGFRSCQEVNDSGYNFGSGTYKMLDDLGNVTSSGCFY